MLSRGGTGLFFFFEARILPTILHRKRQDLAPLENNNSRSACSLNEKILLCLSITSLSCISGVKAKLHPFLNPT